MSSAFLGCSNIILRRQCQYLMFNTHHSIAPYHQKWNCSHHPFLNQKQPVCAWTPERCLTKLPLQLEVFCLRPLLTRTWPESLISSSGSCCVREDGSWSWTSSQWHRVTLGREDRKHLVMIVMVRCTGAKEWAAVTLVLGHGHHGKMPRGQGMGRGNISAWSWPSW